MQRILPKEVAEEKIQAFKELREQFSHLKKLPNGSAQFQYEDQTYTIKKNPKSSTGFQVVPAWREARDAANRRGRKKKQEVKLSSAEQMMVDNYYEEASKRGLHVDHKAPLSKGGPSNHPAFLGLMTPEENGRKGDSIGGDFQYEPLIELASKAGAIFTKKLNVVQNGVDLFTAAEDSNGWLSNGLDKASEIVHGESKVPEFIQDVGNGMNNGFNKLIGYEDK